MLLKYRDSAVQAITISKTLTEMPALVEEKNNPVPEKQNLRNDRSEESALINFFRQVVTPKPPDAKINQCGIIVPIRSTARKREMRQTPGALTNICSLRRATNELIARLRTEIQPSEPVTSAPAKTPSAAIYKYRSKASETYYELPAIAVNQ
jgi:hypothetical protein